MKRTILSLVFLAFTSTALWAQTIQGPNKIEVYGSAEQEVTPDIIYLSISLREYFADNKNSNKVDINALEKQLINAITKAGIKQEDLTINNISSYNYYDPKKKKDPGFLASKQYLLKVSNLNSLNGILEGVDERGIQYTNISKYDYSKMGEVKNQLRLDAVENAKQKAAVIAQALGQKIGKAIEVTDSNTDAGDIQPQQRMYMMKASADNMNMESAAAPEIDFRSTKLNYQLRIVFELL